MLKQTLRFKDSEIYYVIYKNESKPTLCLLHSYASSGLLFDEIIPSLKKIYQIIVVDLPSHGNSKHSNYVTISDMPEIINAIFGKENISGAHFIGISEGSLIAQAFAELYPKQLKSLISISSFSIFSNSYKVVFAENKFKNIKLLYRLFMFKKYKAFYVDKSAYTIKGREAFLKSMVNFNRKSIIKKKDYKRFLNLKYNNVYPTYIVCGNEDLGVIKDASIQYEQIHQKALLEGFSNAKQVVFLDNPRLFIERVKSFISSIEEVKI